MVPLLALFLFVVSVVARLARPLNVALNLGESAQVSDDQGPRVAENRVIPISGYGIADADVPDGNLFDVHVVSGVVRDRSVVQQQVRTLIHIDAATLVAADVRVARTHCRVSDRVYAAARRIKRARRAVSRDDLRVHAIEPQRAVSARIDPIQTVSRHGRESPSHSRLETNITQRLGENPDVSIVQNEVRLAKDGRSSGPARNTPIPPVTAKPLFWMVLPTTSALELFVTSKPSPGVLFWIVV